MTGHDIADETDTRVTCECGKNFYGYTAQKARASHERHVNIQKARAALEEGRLRRGDV